VQPNEGISLRFGAKVPGHEFHIRKASMDFYYSHGYGESRDDAYERVILDALIGDTTLFIRADEVARSWRIVDPLLAYWHQAPNPIPLYHAATWGPQEAAQLIEKGRPPLARPLMPRATGPARRFPSAGELLAGMFY
jgi:glucose-6-phosphate 1-dehydrogenase